ncbi:MAG TPA: methyltransferase domain-containing protein [Candidatus Paceibacterota bacterium]
MQTDNKIKSCRFCGNKSLIPCVDLGAQYLSSIFPKDLNYRGTLQKKHLDLVMCEKKDNTCGVPQLGHSFDMSSMYDEYPFTSSTNSSMPKILKDVLDDALTRVDLKDGDLVLDIGGNDGTLLSFLKDRNLDLLCIDAAKNVKQVFSSDRFKIITDFFNERAYKSATPKKAKLVFSIAMFYHLSDPVQFSKDIASCMSDDGIWVIQMAYLPAMLKTNMYDNIVHEHAGYYATDHVRWVVEKAGLEIFDVSLNDVYGGSFRLFIKKKGNTSHPQTERYFEEIEREKASGIYDQITYANFTKRIEKTRDDLITLCKKIKSQGKKIWVYGASTKGNTILQYCGIGNDLIEAAADSNSFKFNKYIIGSDIPIKNEMELRLAQPDYLLALPYSFLAGFMKREKELLAAGTKFIVPLPEVSIP